MANICKANLSFFTGERIFEFEDILGTNGASRKEKLETFEDAGITLPQLSKAYL